MIKFWALGYNMCEIMMMTAEFEHFLKGRFIKDWWKLMKFSISFCVLNTILLGTILTEWIEYWTFINVL